MKIDGIKKIERARKLVKNKGLLFKCPVCNQSMFVNGMGSLSCDQNHSFDFSKQGYLNLLTAAGTPVYSKELFAARHEVCLAGFYDPLVEMLVNIIHAHPGSKNILDAGCGEGSNIFNIYSQTRPYSNNFFVGADISKDSIQIAANNNADIIWCVADLAKLPFMNQTFDMVINILSPANYNEFQRILTDDGIIVKVVPGAEYLQELREMIYKDRETADYSNHEVIRNFGEKLNVVDIINTEYQFAVSDDLWPHLVKMTPLIWGSSTEKINQILNNKVPHITVDLLLLIGTRR